MKKIITLLYFFALSSTINLSAQNCGTTIPEGFFSDNNLMSAQAFISQATRPKVNISLTFFTSNGELPMNEADLMDPLNAAFEPTGISFTICEVVSTGTSMFVLDKEEEEKITKRFNAPGTINVYATEELRSNGQDVCGYTYLPAIESWDYIFMKNECDLSQTLIHEMGHFFGLLHPHETEGGRELVNGSNCDIAGDLICDTEASPNLSNLVSSNCEYMGNQKDLNSEFYLPTVTNYMSYSRPECTCKLTEGQYKRMIQFYWSHRTHLR